MTTRRTLPLFLSLLLAGGGPAAAQSVAGDDVPVPAEATLWVPSFSAVRADAWLASSLTAVNAGTEAATVTLLATYDGSGEQPGGAGLVTLEPGASSYLGPFWSRPEGSLRLAALRAPRSVLFQAWLDVYESIPPEIPTGPADLGRISIPVFTELIPAGTTAVAGGLRFSDAECNPWAAGFVDVRKVNLALFNAGDGPATVVVDVAAKVPGTTGYPASVTVAARSFVQLNDLPSGPMPVCPVAGMLAGGAFVSVRSDQPFLAYVSTSLPLAPRRLFPFEVFPARALR